MNDKVILKRDITLLQLDVHIYISILYPDACCSWLRIIGLTLIFISRTDTVAQSLINLTTICNKNII